jgi:hypothetical protein
MFALLTSPSSSYARRSVPCSVLNNINAHPECEFQQNCRSSTEPIKEPLGGGLLARASAQFRNTGATENPPLGDHGLHMARVSHEASEEGHA